VTYRYFFMASKPLAPVQDLLSFTPEIIQPMIDIGKGDADTIVKTTKPGESFKIVDDWLDSPSIQQQYPHFVDYLYSEQREVSI
jgi:hypothetical protein